MTACPAGADTLTGELCRLVKRPHITPMSSLTPNATPPSSSPILVLVRDLIFASRIGVVARVVGVEVKVLRDETKLAAENGRRLIVDLNQPGALDAAVEWKRASESASREVIGYVAHVDADTIRRAQDAGIDRVIPRSRFVIELESLLRAHS
jgi:hypothetical protein